MSVQRKRYSAALKAGVALEAIRGQKTANEIAAEYGVHPTQIAQWKKQALDGLPELFSLGRQKQAQSEEALIASLYQQRGLSIERCNQVWSCDITYIRLLHGFIYLMAVMDWYSRYVLSWEISVTLDTSFCLDALDRALQQASPEIFNTDQGVQFTSTEFANRLKAADTRISWDGRGRALDNIFVARLWRSVKYEEVYIKDYQSVPDARRNIQAYFTFYNQERIHQALDYQTPAQVYTRGW